MENIINNLPDIGGGASEQEIEELRQQIALHETEINNLIAQGESIETALSQITFKVNGQDRTILEYTEIVRELQTVFEHATISGGIVDTALNTESINPVQNKVLAKIIPSQASQTNQLADKNFVNSTVGTNTANYISNNGQPFTSLAQLQAYTGTVTNNDYAFVTGTDEQGNTYYDRYKATVSGSSKSWSKEYRLNNSSFTAEQWSAITSGITSSKVSKINEIDGKQNALTQTQLNAVNSGITDLSVQSFNSHLSATNNPHSVTKLQVGLGNVPNVATNDQTPTYTEASTLSALSSGEKLSVAFGKIKKAVASLISHIGNTSNPHSVTAAQIGAITSETQLSKGTTSGSGNAVTDISVSNHKITLTKGSTFLTQHQDISGKVDKVSGKGLSTNDYTTTEKNKLAGIASGAQVNVQSDWNETSTTSSAYIKNKPTIPTSLDNLTNTFYVVCDTESNVATKYVYINDLESLPDICTLVVRFTNSNTVGNPWIALTGKNQTWSGSIKVKDYTGNLIQPQTKSGKWRGSSSSFAEMWQSDTVLTFQRTSSQGSWILFGNQVFEEYMNYTSTSSEGYRVYANGFMEIWGHKEVSTSGGYTLNFPISFKSAKSYIAIASDVSISDSGSPTEFYDKSSSSAKIHRSTTASTSWDYFLKGV